MDQDEIWMRHALALAERVITSYSIHYTKLYENCWSKAMTPSTE